MKPKRVQLSRKKGWRLPPNTVVVSRPTRWGNPFKPQIGGDVQECVDRYEEWVWVPICPNSSQTMADRAKNELRGKNLACWCKLGWPCHADVLLKIAND